MKLAIKGGKKSITKVFSKYNSIGEEELNAVSEVIKSGVLSKYLGAWHEDFYGGPKVREFEDQAASFFDVKHAITVNSWTSGLVAAVGAIDISPGDEVIVTPWTMSASATAILHWNAIPIFADIDPKTYNLDPRSIEKNITSKTKAILVADIFGLSADMNKINEIASKYNLKVISDAAQAPFAMYDNKLAGTLGDIGGYSLNYHKHIHTGEGGILVTNNDYYAEKLKLIRNHGEVVALDKNLDSIVNVIGHNFRLGEIECAIGIEQLKKLKTKVSRRQEIASLLNQGLKGLDGLEIPYVPENQTHSYYMYPIQIDANEIGISKDVICKALQAEGFNISSRYQNIHLLPIYQEKIAYGDKGFPWTADFSRKDISYARGICPNAEELNEFSYIGFGMCTYEWSNQDVKLIIDTFHKVWNGLDELRDL